MNLDLEHLPTGPVGHIGISLALAIVLRLNPVVTVFCGVLPDLVDKPLAAMDIGDGRYVAHTLLFVLLVSAAFALWKWKLGLAALVGGMSHLVLDMNSQVPWFFPFKDYTFDDERFSVTEFLKRYFSTSELGEELLIVAAAGAAILPFLLFFNWRNGRQGQKENPDGTKQTGLMSKLWGWLWHA